MTQEVDWQELSFGEACTFTRKPRNLRIHEFPTIPFVPMDLVPEGSLYSSRFVLKPPETITSGTYFEEGDILLPKITPSFENGKQAIIEGLPTPFGIATTEVIPIKGKPGLSDKIYLFYYLLRPGVRAQLAGKMEGTTGRQRLSKSTLERLQIALPPIKQQQATARALQAVQRANQARQRELALERERKAALMEYLFIHGTRGGPTKHTEIGEIPESWPLQAVGEMFESQLGKMLSQKARVGVNPKPYLRNANVQWGRVNLTNVYQMDFSEREEQKFSLRTGDLLICEGGEIGRTAIWHGELPECHFQKAIHRLRPKSSEIVTPFFLYWMEWAFRFANVYGVAGTQTTIAHLPQEKLEQMKAPKPELEEQKTIASILCSCDLKIAAIEKEQSLYDELFRAALEELMVGRLSVVHLIEEHRAR